ncbi:MAG: phosphoenolpyruvate synthase, partial [Bacteroidaceae bacterium]|nr:phosphoenolpyruvate synthase [Bacteroidaceae bacterium]
AVRSSSLLEDSHYQPFAGIYNTYMVPYLDDRRAMIAMLADAIKGVYASVYFKDSKAYMTATHNVIDQEKMAVVIQEVVGKQYGTRFYPSISGVGRSLNYYPINDERADEGIVSLALGLGKYIVDGGLTLRVSPHHPNKVLQTSEMEIALRETQTKFYALDTTNLGSNFSIDDAFNLLQLPVKEADKDGALHYIASTFNAQDQVIYPGLYPGGRKIISFVGVLEHDIVPFPTIMQEILQLGQEEMRRPVEIEFAVNINAEERTCDFYCLQIRPMVDVKSDVRIDLSDVDESRLILRSDNSLGHGNLDDITDIVYVKTDNFSAANNPAIAREIEQINEQFLASGRHYVLVG